MNFLGPTLTLWKTHLPKINRAVRYSALCSLLSSAFKQANVLKRPHLLCCQKIFVHWVNVHKEFGAPQSRMIWWFKYRLRDPHVGTGSVTELGSLFEKMELFGLNPSERCWKNSEKFKPSMLCIVAEFVKPTKFYFSFVLMRGLGILYFNSHNINIHFYFSACESIWDRNRRNQEMSHTTLPTDPTRLVR